MHNTHNMHLHTYSTHHRRQKGGGAKGGVQKGGARGLKPPHVTPPSEIEAKLIKL